MTHQEFDEEAIFKVACQMASSQERADYVAQACGTNRALWERVELLLRMHEQESFLDGGAPAFATLDQIAVERPGMTVGPYKLMEQIGEGGMGLVFVAEQQEPVRRKVALK